MKNLKTTSAILFVAAMLFSFGLSAQNLIVTLTNSNTESFPVSDIQSIKFGASDMILNESNGTISTWSIDDIDNYAFEGSANINEEFNVVNDNLTIFPNPASKKVNIEYSTNFTGRITIDIINANGKQIQHVYQGSHKGEKQYTWNTNVKPGIYYCRIVTENKVTTKPIIIQ